MGQQPLKREERSRGVGISTPRGLEGARQSGTLAPELCLFSACCVCGATSSAAGHLSPEAPGPQSSSLLLHSVCGEFSTQNGTCGLLYLGLTPLAGNWLPEKRSYLQIHDTHAHLCILSYPGTGVPSPGPQKEAVCTLNHLIPT